MPLEAVMVCMDNSEYQRNGDYSPNRLIAQRETINHIALSKTESNMESTVGVLTMAGKLKVLAAPTRNLGSIMTELKSVGMRGKCDLLAGIKTAQLALKNRQNKNQHPRIIVFVGSPIETDMKKLTKLGAQLKKNSYAVDVINFGKENAQNTNVEKLEAFINAVNNEDNSHLVNVPPGPHNLSDMVASTILGSVPQTGGFGASGTGGGNLSNGGGIAGAAAGAGGAGAQDNTEEALLAYALRISMEEARDRQQKPGESKAESSKMEEEKKEETVKEEGSKMEIDNVGDDEMDEEAELAAAIALSMADEDVEAEDDGGKEDAVGGDADEAMLSVLKEEKFIEDLIDSTGVQKDDIDIQKLLDFSEEDEGKKDEDEEGRK
mmetsp:Transcript_44267/g.73800  ORF Transcript_44267/g.73800 Transcript_44267/m.73800 type:complete len:378 (-) Transcript_44267:207-1340(-)|eukprot:jgi/Bigna1/88880/estExt_fgenesh1_pg.C_390142